MNKRQKKKQIRMKNKRLCKKYPFLLPHNRWNDKVDKDYNYEYTEYDDLDKGWAIAFGKLFLEDLKRSLIKTNYLYDFRFMQIKEKFGGLRLYCNGAPKEVYDVLEKYEYISQYICINCGSPHACIVNNYGWYLPLCKECWEKNNKRLSEKGYKTIPWEKVSEGSEIGLPYSYKVQTYSKEDGENVFAIDISDTVNKIKDNYMKRTMKKMSRQMRKQLNEQH